MAAVGLGIIYMRSMDIPERELMHISIVMPAPGDPGLVGTWLGLPISVLEVQWNDHGRILESPGCKGINRQVSTLDRRAFHTFCNMN